MSTTEQIAWADSHVGESYPNKVNPFIEWQTDGYWTQADFCDAGAQEAASAGGMSWPEDVGCQWGPKGDSYVPYTIVHAQRCGAWRDAGEAPQVGWQPCFDWNGNGVADHIGADVTDVISDDQWVGIEFNAGGGSVRYVWRDKTYLMGFVDPTALVNATVDNPPPPAPLPAPPAGAPAPPLDQFDPPLNWVLTKPMMRGETLALYQRFIRDCLDHDLDADGIYGPATRGAFVDFQRFMGLQVDGVVGRVTATEMYNVMVQRGWQP